MPSIPLNKIDRPQVGPLCITAEHLRLYGYCPVAYKFRFVDKIPYKFVSTGELVALVLQRLYHKGLAYLALHEKLTLRDLTTWGNVLWAKYLGRLPASVELSDFIDFTDHLQSITNVFASGQVQTLTYLIETPFGLNRIYQDCIDLIIKKNSELSLYFFETKNLKSLERSFLTKARVCLAMRQMRRELWGEGYKLRFFIKNLNLGTDEEVFTTRGIIDAVTEVVKDFIKAVRAKIFIPRLQSPFTGCDQCNYRTICPYRELSK